MITIRECKLTGKCKYGNLCDIAESCAYNIVPPTTLPESRLILTKEEAKILSDHLKNEYLTHEEPARSVLLKVHFFADKNK